MRNLFTTLFLIFSFSLIAQDSLRVGLVLSGGGAKGLAHIGVLEVLEENGIIPDMVTGTSMGSVVGGLYSIGYTPSELKELATDLQWNQYFNDNYPRNYLPIEERQRADRYQISFALEKGKIVIPQGLISGKKVQTLLAGITAPVHHQTNFDQYYFPFRCVATDLETGEAYVFSSGNLRDAIRASMSIPTAFDPLIYDSLILVDGLLARNLPVKDALDMGADIIIAVDVGDALYPRGELTSVIKILGQTSSFSMAASTIEQRKLAHIIIDPDLKGLSALSYDSTDAMIEQGRKAAIEALPAIIHLMDSLHISRGPANERPPWRRDSFFVKDLQVLSEDEATVDILNKLLTFPLPKVMTIAEVTEVVGKLYSTGFFNKVDYEFQLAEGGNYNLVFYGVPSPDLQLRGSINYDADLNAGLLLNFTTKNQWLKGSVFSADVKVSEYPALWLDYSVYTRSSPNIGVQWQGALHYLPGRTYIDNKLNDEFRFHHFYTNLDIQSSISRQWHFKLGAGMEHFSLNPRFFDSGDEEEDQLNQTYLYARLIRDTYDRTYFPKDGSLTQASIKYTLGGQLRGEYPTTFTTPTNGNVQFTFQLQKVFPLGQHLWLDWVNASGVSIFNQGHLLNQLYLGRNVPKQDRFFEVYGLRYMEMPSSFFGFTGLQFRGEIGRDNFISLGYHFGYSYLSQSKVFTRNWRELVQQENRFHALGLEIGSVTPLGPVRFTTEYNLDLDRFNLTFYAGYRF